MEKEKIVVILSGGMDSTTLLYDLYNQGKYDINVLTFDYGQRHIKEIEKARITCKKLKLIQQIIKIPTFGGSALTDNIDVPEGHYEAENMKLTYVPNRNMIMLSLAMGYAISIKANKVYYGAHMGDHTIYPDCRKEFLDAMNIVAKIANYKPLEICAPYLGIDKGDIVKIGLDNDVPYQDTWTCYKGEEKACGKCGSCQERLEAFKKNGIRDPISYE